MLQHPSTSSSEGVSRGAQELGQSLERSTERLEDRAVEGIQTLKLRVESGFETQRSRVLERAEHLRDALRAARDQLDPRDPPLGDLLGYADDRIGRASHYLSEADLPRMRRDAADFARRRPGLVFGGALLLGLAAGRLLRAAEPRSLFHRDFDPEEPDVSRERQDVRGGP